MNQSANSDFPELPPYTHVPGRTPHPVSDPDGHMHQHAAAEESRTNQQWFDWALHLFQHGFYWEAHEAWEQLWIELGRRGESANVVKGLIKLAACGVKVLECNQVGAIRHATRAVELLSVDRSEMFGLHIASATMLAEGFLKSPTSLDSPSDGLPVVLPGFSFGDFSSAK